MDTVFHQNIWQSSRLNLRVQEIHFGQNYDADFQSLCKFPFCLLIIFTLYIIIIFSFLFLPLLLFLCLSEMFCALTPCRNKIRILNFQPNDFSIYLKASVVVTLIIFFFHVVDVKCVYVLFCTLYRRET